MCALGRLRKKISGFHLKKQLSGFSKKNKPTGNLVAWGGHCAGSIAWSSVFAGPFGRSSPSKFTTIPNSPTSLISLLLFLITLECVPGNQVNHLSSLLLEHWCLEDPLAATGVLGCQAEVDVNRTLILGSHLIPRTRTASC